MKQIILKYGLYSGIAIALFMIVSSVLFIKNPEMGTASLIVGFAGTFCVFLLIFLAIKKYKNTTENANNTFIKRLLVGLGVACIASAVYTIVWAIEYNFFFPDFLDKWLAVELKNTKPEDIVAKTAEINAMRKDYKNPLYFTIYTLMEVLPIGILYSLVGALIFRKK